MASTADGRRVHYEDDDFEADGEDDRSDDGAAAAAESSTNRGARSREDHSRDTLPPPEGSHHAAASKSQSQMLPQQQATIPSAAAAPSGSNAAAATHAANAPTPLDIRDTPEYAAAWDLELWRAVQMAKVQKEVKTAERKLMEELRAKVAAKEKSDLAHVEKRLRDCAAREAALHKATDALERRKVKVKDLEIELRKQLEETDEFRKRLDAECEARVARVKEEVAHRLELQHERLAEAQEQIKRADDRTASAQKEYLRLYEEFSDFKNRVLSQSGPQVAQQLDAMRAQCDAALLMSSERYDRRLQDADRAHREELQRVNAEFAKVREQLSTRKEQSRAASAAATTAARERDEARAECRRLAAELGRVEAVCHQLNQRLLAQGGGSPQPQWQGHGSHGAHHHQRKSGSGEEAAALRRSIDRQLGAGGVFDAAAAAAGSSSGAGRGQRPTAAAGAADGDDEARVQLRHEVARWARERDALLRESGGVYTNDSPIVADLNRRILHAQQLLATV